MGEPQCQEHGGTARGDKSQGLVTEVGGCHWAPLALGGGCGGQWAQRPLVHLRGRSSRSPRASSLLALLSLTFLLYFTVTYSVCISFIGSQKLFSVSASELSPLAGPIPSEGGPGCFGPCIPCLLQPSPPRDSETSKDFWDLIKRAGSEHAARHRGSGASRALSLPASLHSFVTSGYFSCC